MVRQVESPTFDAVARALRALDPGGAAIEVREPDLEIGGARPLARVSPADVDAVRRVVDAMAALGLMVVAVGGETGLRRAPAPARPFIALSTRRLTGIIDYPAADLTVTVRAGTSWAALARLLAREAQWLPVETVRPEAATVGGCIARATAGALRLGHGTLRDYLIGITVVDGLGRVVRSGGRVVKNVAGYDLGKLYHGSWGSLAVIVEATFKLKPKPERLAWLWLELDDPARADRLWQRLAVAGVQPVALELLGGTARELVSGARPRSADGWIAAVAVEGLAGEVDWQLDRVGEAAAGLRVLGSLTGDAADGWRQQLVDLGAAGIGARAGIVPTRACELARRWLEAAPDAGVTAGIGTGVVHMTVASLSPDRLEHVWAVAAGLDAHIVVDPAPSNLPGIRRPQPSHPVLELTVRLKESLDPRAVFPEPPAVSSGSRSSPLPSPTESGPRARSGAGKNGS